MFESQELLHPIRLDQAHALPKSRPLTRLNVLWGTAAIVSLTMACSSSDPTPQTGNVGGTAASNGGATSSGGAPSNGGVTTGGNATGGNTATNAGGNNATGGNTSAGGVATGGKAEGGSAAGGNNVGGKATGGVATGGRNVGGNATGGVATGGSNVGGNATGGKATGGNNVGGTATGGKAEGGSATGGAATGGSVGAGGAPTAGTCSIALADRVKITPIAVSPNVNASGSGIGSPSRPVILATAPNGTAKVAWTDGTNVHITPLDNADQRAGDDVVITGSEVRGLVAHDDGSAVLVVRSDAMVFVRLDASGTAQSTLSLVGGNAHTTEGDRWIDTWPHQGRLAWSGTQYAAYFGQTGNHGSAGNHQGDHYSFITASGTLASGGWNWGCSHSLDERLAHNGTAWAPLCTSDTYPGAGIWFNNRTEVSPEPSITNMGGGAKLGGLVPTSDGFYFTFTTPAGRASFDVAFLKLSNTGSPSGKTYLTDTASVVEQYAYLAKYGDALLAGWATTAGALTIAAINTAGTITEGPAAITSRVGSLDDFASYPNGDVGWAYAWSDLSKLQVTRVTRCP